MCEKDIEKKREINRKAMRNYRTKLLRQKGQRGRLLYLTLEEYEKVKQFLKDLRKA
uniref:BZIP domain-containing protein n=1 Tax=Dulem virus 29 TaxID=3145747 RepID=A0AAU8B5H8_9CAUD